MNPLSIPLILTGVRFTLLFILCVSIFIFETTLEAVAFLLIGARADRICAV